MRKTFGLGLAFVLLVSMLTSSGLAAAPDGPAAALAPMTCAPDGTQASGAKYRICMPASAWNGDLLVYAHGYVAPNEPIGIPEDQLNLGGTYIPDAANLLGYAFATTSYSVNGLAVKQGLPDLVDLVNIFRTQHPTLKRVILVGVSEGGLITTLATEQYPDVFNGGLAACGPIGDFRRHTNYVADFRTVFDYFFPGLIPGSAVSIPEGLIANWPTYYTTTVAPVIAAPGSAISVTQLLDVTGVPYDPGVRGDHRRGHQPGVVVQRDGDQRCGRQTGRAAVRQPRPRLRRLTERHRVECRRATLHRQPSRVGGDRRTLSDRGASAGPPGHNPYHQRPDSALLAPDAVSGQGCREQPDLSA